MQVISRQGRKMKYLRRPTHRVMIDLGTSHLDRCVDRSSELRRDKTDFDVGELERARTSLAPALQDGRAQFLRL